MDKILKRTRAQHVLLEALSVEAVYAGFGYICYIVGYMFKSRE